MGADQSGDKSFAVPNGSWAHVLRRQSRHANEAEPSTRRGGDREEDGRGLIPASKAPSAGCAHSRQQLQGLRQVGL
jgi:hypothetical protein